MVGRFFHYHVNALLEHKQRARALSFSITLFDPFFFFLLYTLWSADVLKSAQMLLLFFFF